MGYKKLHSDLTTCTLDESDGKTVTLQAVASKSGEGFKNAHWLFLDGHGYESAEQAFEVGIRWRQYLSVAFARAEIAADFDTIATHEPNDLPRLPDAPGLVVYPYAGPRLEGFAPDVRIVPLLESFLSNHLAPVRESTPEGFESLPADLKRRLVLAYRLVHLALLNIAPDVEYIIWMTAVEALIPDDKPEKDDAELVAALKEVQKEMKESERWDKRIRDRVAEILGEAQNESIHRLGVKVAGKLGDKTYDEKTPKKFFIQNYSGRSFLVHGSIDEAERPDTNEILRRLPHLQKFVIDLLAVEASS